MSRSYTSRREWARQQEYSDEADRKVLAARTEQKADAARLRLLRKYGNPQSRFPKFSGTVAGKGRHDRSGTG